MTQDLAIKFGEIQQKPTMFPDELGKLQVLVTNQGNTPFNGPASLRLYASTDNQPDLNDLNTLGQERGAKDPLKGTDELLGTLNQNFNLAPGQSQTVSIDFAGSDFRTPSVVSPGVYYLFGEVQPGNNIPDNNPANNVAKQLISQGDVVIQWNSVLLNAIQASGKGDARGTAPPLAARNQAIVHAAIYDAVNAFEQSKHKPYLVNDNAPQGASQQAAAVGAAYTTLAELFANQKGTFEEQKNKSLEEITDTLAAEKAGFDFGAEVARKILAARRNDGSAQANDTSYRPGNDPGDFQPIPLEFQPEQPSDRPGLPGWGLVKPFAIPNVSQFRPEGPPEFSSPLYGREIERVREFGGKFNTNVTQIKRDSNQTEIAQFWAYDRDDTFRPPGQLNEVAQEIALAKGTTLAQNARLFALLNIAQADAGIVGWDAKYTYDQLRPITAIRNANSDNNPLTKEDKEWQSLIGTPNFPDYVSGHSVFGGVSAEILARFFGNNVSFNIPSRELPGVARSYSSFTEIAKEDAISRVYGGVHNDLATVDGVKIGQDIGKYVFENFLT